MCEISFYFFFSLFPTRMSNPGGLVFHIPSSVPRTGVELLEPLCVRDTGEGIPSLGGKLHSIDPILLTHSCCPRVPQCYYSSHVSLPYWKNNFWDFKSPQHQILVGLESVLFLSKIAPKLMVLIYSLRTSVGILYICCHSTLGSWVLAWDLESFMWHMFRIHQRRSLDVMNETL